MLLTNFTAEAINIDSIGAIDAHKRPFEVSSDTFRPLSAVSPKGQDYIDLTKHFPKKLLETAEYVYARNLQGRYYRSKKIQEIDSTEVSSTGDITTRIIRTSVY